MTVDKHWWLFTVGENPPVAVECAGYDDALRRATELADKAGDGVRAEFRRSQYISETLPAVDMPGYHAQNGCWNCADRWAWTIDGQVVKGNPIWCRYGGREQKVSRQCKCEFWSVSSGSVIRGNSRER
jgi:hypothetical protein